MPAGSPVAMAMIGGAVVGMGPLTPQGGQHGLDILFALGDDEHRDVRT